MVLCERGKRAKEHNDDDNVTKKWERDVTDGVGAIQQTASKVAELE